MTGAVGETDLQKFTPCIDYAYLILWREIFENARRLRKRSAVWRAAHGWLAHTRSVSFALDVALDVSGRRRWCAQEVRFL